MLLQRRGPAGREIPAVLLDGTAYDLRPLTVDIDGTFLAGGGVARVADAIAAGSLRPLPDQSVRVGAPLAAPTKIVCIGLNYRDHAAESGLAVPEEPVVFMKDPSTIVGPFDTSSIPKDSVKTDWEVELGVVIGRTARYLASPTTPRRALPATCSPTTCPSANSNLNAAANGTRARAARPSTRWARGCSRPMRLPIPRRWGCG